MAQVRGISPQFTPVGAGIKRHTHPVNVTFTVGRIQRPPLLPVKGTASVQLNMTPEETLDLLYAEIPEMECKGLCGDVYCGPIGMGKTERLRILDRIGHPPFSRIFPAIEQPGELALLAFHEHLSQSGGVACLKCPMLVDNKCRVYDIRPMICRLWGAVEDLRCPHGCRPKELMKRADGKRLLKAACAV